MRVTIDRRTDEMDELIDPAAELELVGSGFLFTEGPAWHPGRQDLVFSDIPGNTRYRWSEAGGVVADRTPTHKGNGMVYERTGGLLVCEHATGMVVRYSAEGDRQVVASHYQGTELNSPNDVITRSDGSIWFSDPNYGRVGRSADTVRDPSPLGFTGVFRIPAGSVTGGSVAGGSGAGGSAGDGELELVVAPGEFDQPNGLCFSPDEQTLYVDDLNGLKALAVDADGSLGPARVLRDDLRVPGVPGVPDGMRCDERGHLWCTASGGVWVLTPDGEVLGVIRTPESAANLVWGGPDLHTLFLCTSTTVHALRTLVGPSPLPYHALAS